MADDVFVLISVIVFALAFNLLIDLLTKDRDDGR